MRPFPVLLPLSIALLAAGCTMGPDYAGPQPLAAAKAPGAAFARADTGFSAEAPLARWWESLHDAVLDDLVRQALAANPDARVAEARLRQARSALRLERANGSPNVNAQAVYAHAHLPGVDFGGEGDSGDTNLNLYNLGFDASWEIDLFGGQRRKVEAARAEAEAAGARLADAQVSLSAEVAQAYVNLRDRQERIALSRQSITMLEQMVDLARQRRDRGTASQLDVDRLEGQLEQAKADVAGLDAEQDAYLDELATLTGAAPGTLDARLRTPGALPLPPAAIAIGDPAALIRRRPDIRAAERTLAADTAKIGAAKAARFPRLSLMGIIGIGGTSFSDLTHLDDFAAIAAPQLSWSFLDFGRNKARVGQAEGVRDEAEAQYQGAVLAALRDAEDALSRFRNRRIAVATLARAEALATRTAGLSRDRYRAGTITLTDLLDAERQQLAARQRLSAAKAGLTGDFIAIQKALGAGWRNGLDE
ncbi:efflux transporter outer membrane subunit [Sphingomonas fennica]|uniref:RND transporter n=1 Tax=Edaphosphingomonas fennica TaxID=114404 RepID=A0A2T4HT72_9SPHN|nr:efflux transporter outer membrane subunit [Sphingomonas fennica]PTD19009.1 RND transporter [Sphingomonas fennica]